MSKNLMKNVCMVVLAIISGIYAIEPNFVRTTLLKVNGTDDVITTEYFDEVGRSIQWKKKLGSDRDQTYCTYYNGIGKKQIVTNMFVDNRKEGAFLPGTISSTDIKEQLELSNQSDTRAYMEFEYWNDPAGELKIKTRPGSTSAAYKDSIWLFGVAVESVQKDVSLTGYGSVKFQNGMIIEIVPATGISVSAVLDQLYSYLLVTNPFTGIKTHHLMVSLTIGEVSGSIAVKISEDLTDIYERTVRTYDAPKIGSTAGSNVSASYTFDILGNVRCETPPVASTNPINPTSFEYNTLGKIIQQTFPDGLIKEYTYFPDGNVQFETSKLGGTIVRKLTYSYDVLGRPLNLKEYGPNIDGGFSSNERDITSWYYDRYVSTGIFSTIPESRLALVENTKNRLAASIYSNHGAKRTYVGEIYSYDAEGRLRFKILVIEGISGFQETWYEYDLLGKTTADISIYGNEIIKKKYTYDAQGLLKNIYHSITTDGGATYTDKKIAEYTYNDLGNMSTKDLSEFSGGYSAGFSYDIRNRLKTITKPTGKGFAETITYDNGGNVKKALYHYTTSSPNEFELTYNYDDLSRLKTATPTDATQTSAYGTSYDYDEVGRIKTKQEGTSNITGYDYYDANNRLEKTSIHTSGEEYVYDAFGNCVIDCKKKMVIEYDWRNMPVVYRFYDAIPAGITKNATGTCTNSNLYAYIKSKVDDATIQLVSTVTMLYDVNGKRIGKVEIQE